MTTDDPPHHIIDGVLSTEELLDLYHQLQATPKWTLDRHSKQKNQALANFGAFPGFVVEHDGEALDEYFSGYFRSLIFRIRQLAIDKLGKKLPRKIFRIHLNANNSASKTEPHKDLDREGAWTILGFLNPVWNANDGGHLQIGDHKIEYASGRFVLFPSNLTHVGGFVKNEKLSYWRITLNIVLVEDETTGTE